MFFVNNEHENWNLSLDGAIELHLSNRNIMAFRNRTVAPGINADINVSAIDHFERDFDGVRVAGRKALHHVRKISFAQAGIAHFRTVLRQVDRRAADHRGLLARLVHRDSMMMSIRFAQKSWLQSEI